MGSERRKSLQQSRDSKWENPPVEGFNSHILIEKGPIGKSVSQCGKFQLWSIQTQFSSREIPVTEGLTLTEKNPNNRVVPIGKIPSAEHLAWKGCNG